MSLPSKLAQFGKLLISKGFHQEAKMLKKVCHYVSKESSDIPSFWRSNYDYGPEGDSYYYGDMSEKEPLGEWRKKHKGKGPNFPKKKAISLPSTPQAEYSWHCSCGERFTNEEAAWKCKKCREYLTPEDYAQRDVIYDEGE